MYVDMLKSSRKRNLHFRQHVMDRLNNSIQVLETILAEHSDEGTYVHLRYALRRLLTLREECNTSGLSSCRDARVIACAIHNQFLVDDLSPDDRSKLRQVQEVLDRELSGSYWMKCVLERRLSKALMLLAVRR